MLNIPISSLFLFIGLLLAIVCFFFIIVILQKRADIRRAILKTKEKERLRPIIFAYLSQNDRMMFRDIEEGRFVYEAVDELLEEYGQVLKGEEVQTRILLFVTTYMLDYYRANLQSKRWAMRMNALYKIENLKLYHFEGQLWELFQHGPMQDEERFQVLRTLASLRSTHLEAYIVEESPGYSLTLYKEILRNYNEEAFNRFITKVHQLPIIAQKAMIEIVGERRDLHHLPFVEMKLQREELEIRISALKAILLIGTTTLTDPLMPFASSPYWQERMLFAKLAGKLLKERFKPLLVQLISDENWFVRNAAGESLFYYQDGHTILRYIVEQHEDVFAKDTARQWVEKGAW